MSKRLRQITIALTIIGLLVSIYMTIYKLTNNESMCIGSSGCSEVNASRYSEINGIPVAVLGVVGYAAILALLFLEQRSGFIQENGSMIFFGISLIGFLFTLYLIYIEIALIKAYCPFCLASQAVMIVIFIFSVIRLARQP
ncbi:MAG TPA: vitamin K epoxide reductase family protein [Anaerolineales bacterium]|nr:vitamin K epoxide reductase family protein [Anaerolineales bacterium]